MFYIVEFEEQLKKLSTMVEQSSCFVHVIPSNDSYHPALHSTSAVYIRVLESKQGFIIPINHDEGINVEKNRVLELLKKCKELLVIDRKRFIYHFNIQAATDLSLLAVQTGKDKPNLDYSIPVLNWFQAHYESLPDLNCFLPISKLFEKCELIYNDIEEKQLIGAELPEGFDFYNKISTNVFYLIEKSGLGITEAFKEINKVQNPEFNIQENTVFTYYNLYNITSRPTNAFNSINFAAIPKDEAHRSCIIPLNDYFVELDFDGYHLRLIADLIEHPLTSESAHLQLAKTYLHKDQLTEEEYVEAKKVHFQAIYGTVPKKYKKVAFFEKIDHLINKLWEDFVIKGYIEDPISKKQFKSSVYRDMSPTKLMNYLIQSVETSRNIVILKEILGFLKDKQTRVRLYTYDAIILDVSEADTEECLLSIKSIAEENGKYPVHLKRSDSLVL